MANRNKWDTNWQYLKVELPEKDGIFHCFDTHGKLLYSQNIDWLSKELNIHKSLIYDSAKHKIKTCGYYFLRNNNFQEIKTHEWSLVRISSYCQNKVIQENSFQPVTPQSSNEMDYGTTYNWTYKDLSPQEKQIFKNDNFIYS